MEYRSREERRRQDMELRIGRRVDDFIDDWNLCVSNQDRFRAALVEMIVESEEQVLELQGRANMRKIDRLLRQNGEE